MIWMNTDYAHHLLQAAERLLRHYGEPDAQDLEPAIVDLRHATDEWGRILWTPPHTVSGSINNDTQDLLYNVADAHQRFDEAVTNLEQAMRALSLL